MKKLLIIGTLITLLCVGLLSGCGYNWHYWLFNLCSWSSTNTAFNNCIASLDTPQKIYDYMRPPNWTYTMHDTGVSPYQAWSQEWGDCKEWSIFATYAALQNGYSAYQIRMTFRKSDGKVYGHVIPVIKVGSSYVYIDIYNWYDDDMPGAGGNKFYTFQSVVDHCERGHFGSVTEWKAYDKCFNIVATQEGTRLDKYSPPRENPSEFVTVVGCEAINENSGQGNAAITCVNKSYPALYSGTIRQVAIYADVNLSNVQVASFFIVSGNNLSTRDYETIGSVTAGSRKEFNVNITIQAGDYIGIYFSAGTISSDNSTGKSVGLWIASNDKIPCTNQVFYYYSNVGVSLEGVILTSQ